MWINNYIVELKQTISFLPRDKSTNSSIVLQQSQAKLLSFLLEDCFSFFCCIRFLSSPTFPHGKIERNTLTSSPEDSDKETNKNKKQKEEKETDKEGTIFSP